MRKLFLLTFITAASCFVNAQNKEPYMTKSFSGESVKGTEVQTSGGSISVTGVNSVAETKVEVYVLPNGNKNELSKAEIDQRLKDMYDLSVTVNNNKLMAIAKPKHNINDWKKALNISFKVFVLKNISTDLTTSGGSISLTNLTGDQKFTTSGGSLNVDNVGGKIDGTTSGGSIMVENSRDDIDLTTSGGSIDARNCDGKIRLSTSGGSLSLKDLKGDIKATTSGGSVNGRNISGELVAHTSGGGIQLTDLSCSLEASNSGGHIDIEIKELGKYVKISNSGGGIDLQLPKNAGVDLDLTGGKIKTEQLGNFNGKIEDDQLEGKLNGGGVSVKVRSSGGRINLAFK
jgi:preprotein translocase subunit YajC